MSQPPENDNEQTPQQKMLENLQISLAEKLEAERAWQALAQAGVVIDTYESTHSYKVQLTYKHTRDGFRFQTDDCTSVHWDKEFFVFRATNKKEAVLMAKFYILHRIVTLRVEGQSTWVIKVDDIAPFPKRRQEVW